MKIGILGAGRLGLCFGLNLERSRHEVLGVDISEEYVQALNDCVTYIICATRRARYQGGIQWKRDELQVAT